MNFHNLLFVFREISPRPGTTWNRGVLRRLFRGFPLDEMNARLASEFPERAAIQASIKEYIRSLSLSLSVCLSLSLYCLHLLRVVKFRKLSLKFKFQRAVSVSVFFSRFFCQRKTQTGKMFRKLTHFVYRLIPVAQ